MHDLNACAFVDPGAKALLSAFRGIRYFDGISEVLDYSGNRPLILTSYLPREKAPPAPYYVPNILAGIEALKLLRKKQFSNAVVLLSFQTKESLLAFPGNQILEAEGTMYLQLPLTKDQIIAMNSAEPLHRDKLRGVICSACDSWGQLKGFILKNDRSANDTPRKNLRSFINRDFRRWQNDIPQMERKLVHYIYPSLLNDENVNGQEFQKILESTIKRVEIIESALKFLHSPKTFSSAALQKLQSMKPDGNSEIKPPKELLSLAIDSFKKLAEEISLIWKKEN